MPTDTPQEREEKIKKTNENYRALEEIKNDKFEDINNLLEIFGGQLSLTDILNQDIPFLNKLREVRNKSNEKMAKERAKQQKMMQQQFGGSSNQNNQNKK